MKWSAIKKGGAKATMKFKVACFERFLALTKAAVAGQDASPELKLTYYNKVLAKSHTWPEVPGEADELSDVCEPTLPSVGATDHVTAKLLTSTVFSWIANLVKFGESSKDEVLQHASLALSKLDLPEDAEIGDECTRMHISGMTALGALQTVGNDGITDKTDLESLQSLEELDTEGHRTEGAATPMQLLGAAILANPWWAQRFGTIMKSIEMLKAEGQKIKQRCKEMRQMSSDLGEQKIKQFIAIAEEIKYWDATFKDYDAAGALTETLISAAESNVKSLLEMKDDKYCLEIKMEARAVYINVFQKLYGVLKGIAPSFDTKIHNTTVRLNQALRNMDSEIQNGMLIESCESWTNNEEATLKLKDALERTAKKTLPAECADATNKLWLKIYTEICAAEDKDFLVSDGDRIFTVLTLLAAQVPEGDKDKFVQLSSWVHAAWRLVTLGKSANQMKKEAEAPENDISMEATDKCSRELLKGVQRLECQHAAASKFALAKENGAFERIGHLVNNARDMVISIATAVRKKMVTELLLKQTDLSGKLLNCKDKTTFDTAVEKATNLTEIKTCFSQGYETTDTTDWLAACVEIEEGTNALRSKVLEFGLFVGDEPPEQDAQKFITTVRAACMEHAVLLVCCNKTIAKDKTVIRKKMRDVQANMKTFEIKPTDLKMESVVAAYSAGLKMQPLPGS